LRLLKRKFFGYCAGFVVPGTSAAEYLEKFGVDRERILLAPNAVDTELFSGCGKAALRNAARLRAELTLPDRYFLYVGRLVQSKGVLDLLDAYRSIPAELRSQVGLVLAGDGPLRSELEARAREISPGCVSFSGFVHREDLATYYSLAECLVLPTLSDTWGLVVNEAMACGLPVICTEVAGCAADLVQNSGILVPPGDPKQLSEAMQTMASDRVSRDAMSCVAANLIQFYSPEVCAAGLAQASLASGAHVA
jgi:glycosyltransferase involved in cell wall biosynthesis